MKSNISRFSLYFGLLLILISQSLIAQNLTDYAIIDLNAPNQSVLLEQYSGNPQVFFNESQKPALYVHNQMLMGRMVNNLFVYVQTQPGVLNYGGGAISNANIDDYADVLSGWSSVVKGSIIIHSADVFSGSEGAMLKSKLESLTGCTVVMSMSLQPFSN